LRAIELRKQIVRSANTSVSAIVDEFGAIHQATGYEQKTVITVNVKSNNIKTFFARTGDLISYASVLFSLCLIVFGIYLKFKK
jgi:apolipoprotein N-acyltransferase